MQRLMPSPGQATPPAAPLQQRRPEIAFEGLNPSRYRGFCRDEPLGGLAKVARGCRPLKGFQVSQSHERALSLTIFLSETTNTYIFFVCGMLAQSD